MAYITNVQAIQFCNEQIRPLANRMAQLYYDAKGVVDEWNANSLSAVIPNTSDVIVDGSATDGRPIITGAKATNIVTRAQEVIADYEASSNAKLNTVLQVAVDSQG